MAKQTTSIRFDEDTKKLVQQYPTSQRGVEEFTWRVTEIIRTASDMLRHTKRELAGLLTQPEACLIADVCNSLLYYSNVNPKSVLLGSVEDGCILDGLAAKWDVDKAALLAKLNSLTEYQAYVVLTMAFEFWQNPNPDTADISKIFLCKE